MNDDSVNRVCLAYRAGWVEALKTLTDLLRVQGIRCKRGEAAGLSRASQIAQGMHQRMLQKMKAGDLNP